MKVHELLNFNKELLKRIHTVGIKPDDYKYIDLFNEYQVLLEKGEKVTYIVATLSASYHISERKVYNVIGKFNRDINLLQTSCS